MLLLCGAGALGRGPLVCSCRRHVGAALSPWPGGGVPPSGCTCPCCWRRAHVCGDAQWAGAVLVERRPCASAARGAGAYGRYAQPVIRCYPNSCSLTLLLRHLARHARAHACVPSNCHRMCIRSKQMARYSHCHTRLISGSILSEACTSTLACRPAHCALGCRQDAHGGRDGRGRRVRVGGPARRRCRSAAAHAPTRTCRP
jgi:hypothetical protein